MQDNKILQDEMSKLLEAIGLDLVELAVTRGRGETRVHAVIYSKAGTGLDACSKAHRLMAPRLQVLLGEADIYIEVSSPGIDRVIRTEREYELFKGKGVKVHVLGDSEWTGGLIEGVLDGRLLLKRGGETVPIDLSTVTKARLDSTQEGE